MSYIPEPGDTDQDRLEWALKEIERLQGLYRRLREAAVVQHEAYGAYPGLIAVLRECPNE